MKGLSIKDIPPEYRPGVAGRIRALAAELRAYEDQLAALGIQPTTWAVKADTDPLDRLIARLSSLIAAATETLERDPTRVDDWYDEVARQLRRYTLAAYVSGQGGGDPARDVVQAYTRAQLEFLAAFRDEITAAGEWSNSWPARAQMYAESIKAPWWAGRTRDWPLPAMPGDGTTTCLTRCKCSWRIDELEGDGNADAYWIYGATEEHCQGCIERSQQWNPLQIREGVLL